MEEKLSKISRLVSVSKSAVCGKGFCLYFYYPHEEKWEAGITSHSIHPSLASELYKKILSNALGWIGNSYYW